MTPHCHPMLTMNLPSKKSLLSSCKECSWLTASVIGSLGSVAVFKPTSCFFRQLPANDRAWWVPTSWPFLPKCKTPLMAASLPTFILSFIQYWLPKGLELPPLEILHMVSKAFLKGLPLPALASLGAPLILYTLNFMKIQPTFASCQTCQAHSCMPLSWPLHKVSPRPGAWSTTQNQSGKFLFAASLPNFTHLLSNPPQICPSKTWMGLDTELGEGKQSRHVYWTKKWVIFSHPKTSCDSLQ